MKYEDEGARSMLHLQYCANMTVARAIAMPAALCNACLASSGLIGLSNAFSDCWFHGMSLASEVLNSSSCYLQPHLNIME